MATWAELTTEEQGIVQNYVDTLIRPTMGELARVNNHLDAANTDYLAQASAILATLTGTEEIPNGSGLAGSAVLTANEVITLTSYAQGILTNYNTSGHRQNYALAAGAINLIG